MTQLTRRQFLALTGTAGSMSALAVISTGCQPTPSDKANDSPTSDNKETTDQESWTVDPTSQAEPVAVFMLISDTHLGHDEVDCEERLADALTQIAEFERRPDTIVINGDITNGGHQEEYDQLRAIIDDSDFDFSSDFLFVCGNHDHYTGDDNSREAFDAMHERFTANTGAPLYYDRMVADMHLICMGPDGLASRWDRFNITDEQVAWVEGLLEEDEKSATLSFVFCHEPLPDTVFGTEKGQWGYDASIENPEELRAMLERHPSTVFVTGHTHVIPDARRATKASPTYVNEGSCGFGYDPRAGFDPEHPLSNGMEAAVYDDRIEFRVRDFIEATWGQPTVIERI